MLLGARLAVNVIVQSLYNLVQVGFKPFVRANIFKSNLKLVV